MPREISFVSIDLSFISVTKVLPSLKESLAGDACARGSIDVIVLVKPQFEVGKRAVGKGGIVQDPAKRLGALDAIIKFALHTGFQVMGSLPSPVSGARGNQEFLLHLQLAKGLLSSP